MATRKHCPRTVVLSQSRQSTVSHMCPHTAPRVWQGQKEQALGLRSPFVAIDEQLVSHSAVSLDADAAHVSSQ